MPTPPRPRLVHASIKVRVSVDPAAYAGRSRTEIVKDLRELVIQAVRQLPGVVSARRDSDHNHETELGN